MPRLVRRQPLWERINAVINPMDFMLWLSEEMETRDWDSGILGTQIGLGLNFVFLILRANSGSKQASDDLFSDDSPRGWLSVLLYPLAWGLVAFSVTNAVYTFARTRKYRLFEANIEVKPITSSARRVKVQSSPVASSPLRFISDMISSDSAESRAHPDKNRDVWELAIWDPLPVCIRLLCLFSPGHVLVYLIFLPLAPLDPRPSVTVFNTIIMQVVLSVQMILLSSRYSQQAKDTAIIQKEVFHEYDTNFVQPRLHPVVRDVGTQMSEDQPAVSREFVQVGTPTTLIRKSFITHTNPHVEAAAEEPTPSQVQRYSMGNVLKPSMFTPATGSRRSEVFTPAVSSQRSSNYRQSLPAGYSPSRETPTAFTPAMPPSTTSVGTSAGLNSAYGGNAGVYSRKKSPLKKTVSLGNMEQPEQSPPRSSREPAAYEHRGQQQFPSSPLKHFEPRRAFTGTRVDSSPHPFANMGRHQPSERFPKRRQAY